MFRNMCRKCWLNDQPFSFSQSCGRIVWGMCVFSRRSLCSVWKMQGDNEHQCWLHFQPVGQINPMSSNPLKSTSVNWFNMAIKANCITIKWVIGLLHKAFLLCARRWAWCSVIQLALSSNFWMNKHIICSRCAFPSDVVPCSHWPLSGNSIRSRWSRMSAAADCSCSAWQEEPAGLTSEGQWHCQ